MNNKYLRFLALVVSLLSAQLISAQACNDTVIYISPAPICQGTTYNFNGVNLDSGGTYNDTFVVAGGCDSIISLQLSFIPISYNTMYDTICAGATYDFYGTTVTAPGTYGDTLFAASGCDSVILLYLAVGPGHNDTFVENVTYCATAAGAGGGGGGGYNFYGTRLRASGTYYHTGGQLPGATSCADSVIELNLLYGAAPVTIGVAPGGGGGFGRGTADTIRTCASSYDFYGTTLTADGNYADTLISSIGCDSEYIYITLLLNSGYNSAAVAGVSCGGAPFVFEGNSYPGPAGGGGGGGGRPVTYYDTVAATGGCDTIYTITVTNGRPGPTVSMSASFCQGGSYTYEGYTFTTAGIDTITEPAPGGCDSTIALHLTYLPAPTFTMVDSFCEGSTYTYRGYTFNDSGLHSFTEPNPAGGCDSVIQVQLSYKSAPTINVNASFCEGLTYTYRGVTYDTAGLYPITIAAPTGCDSVINLNLTYSTPPSATITATICQGSTYTYEGNTFNRPGTYNILVSHAGMCDSAITITLTPGVAPRQTVMDSFCQGTTFTYGDSSYTTAGTYTFQIAPGSGTGCDTIVTLLLTYKAGAPVPTISAAGSALIVNPADSSYQWYLNGTAIAGATSQIYTPTQSGVYYATITGVPGTCPGVSANDTIRGLGITDVSASDMFKLYPNPNNGQFTIETAQFVGADITIYDMLGRVVYQKLLTSGKQTIDLSDVTDGTYYLVMKNQQSSSYAHFVIAH